MARHQKARLKIATLNSQRRINKNILGILQLMQPEHIDILLLQEVTNTKTTKDNPEPTFQR